VHRSNLFRRLAGGAVVFAVATAAAVLGAAAASAQPPSAGTLTVAPATGTDLTAPSVTTSAGCPAPANAYNIQLTGPNGLDFIVTGRTQAGFSTTAPFTGQFGQTFKDAAALDTPPTTIVAGTYHIALNCVSGITGATIVAAFNTDVTFTSPTAYQAGTPATPTTTALAASPPSPITAGTQTTLTASVTPANATGSVEFFDGTTSLGTPVAVAGGAAAAAVTLAEGSHTLTAVLTAGGDFGDSTSTAVTYQVNVPQQTTTTDPTTTTGDTTTTTTTAESAVAANSTGGGGLAGTGVAPVTPLWIGLLLCLVGTLYLLAARRPRAS
jgi:Bacterial Ig-like domain (group 3)